MTFPETIENQEHYIDNSHNIVTMLVVKRAFYIITKLISNGVETFHKDAGVYLAAF